MCFMSIEGREHSSICSISKKFAQEIALPLIISHVHEFPYIAQCFPFADDTREPPSIAEGYKLLGNFTFLVITIFQ